MQPSGSSLAFIRLSMCVVIVTAALVMYGWCFPGIPTIQIGESSVAMQFNTALMLCIGSIAFICIDYGKRGIASVLLSGVALFACITLVQYPLKADFGIDTLFIAAQGGTYSNRIPPTSLFALVLSSIALLLCNRPALKSDTPMMIATLFGSITAALGAATMLAYIGGLENIYVWDNFTRMALSTSFCLIIMGINVVVFIWKKLGGTPLWLPMPIYIGFVTITFSLAQLVRLNEETEFHHRLQANAESLASEGTIYLENLYNALERIKERWVFEGGTPEAAWEHDATGYVRDFPFITGLTRTDASSRILWIAPVKATSKLHGFQLNSEPRRAAAFAKAIDTRKSQVTRKISLIGGGTGFLYINPLFVGDRFDGSLVAGIKYADFFKALLTYSDNQTFYISVYESGELLYSNIPKKMDIDTRWTKTAALRNKESVWVLSVIPTRQMLASRNSQIPWIVLGVGLLTSFLIGISIMLSLKGRQDNLELQKTGRDLDASNRLSNTILSSSSYMIIATDIAGKVIVFNREAEYELGYRREEVLHKATPILWHVPEEIHARAAALTKELGESVDGFHVLTKKAEMYGAEQSEWEFVRKDGSTFPGLLSVTPLKNTKGETVGYLGITNNITRRKKQEDALRASEEVFRNTMDHASIGMALVSPEGKWLRVNQALCTLLGYNSDEMLVKNFQEITHPDDLQEDLKFVNKLLHRELETYSMEKRYFHKDGHIIWILLNVSLVWNSDGTPKHFIGQIQDITESKKSRQAMETLIDKLVAANEELEQFAYVASHDLQEPLRMVISFTDLIRQEYEEKLDAAGKEYIEFAICAARRMQQMINDLLEYARIDNKAESMIRVDAEQQLTNVLGNLQGVIAAQGAVLIHDPLPCVAGNPMRFMRLLQNLVGNALKYQKPGNTPYIHIGVEDKGSYWRFFVRDNGIGIDKEYVDTIFLPFERLHSSDEYQGSGIGLAICRKIVESHGGTLWAESQPDEGSTFYFTMQKWV
jgi:PAS domain S-box-containing protein